MFIIFAAAATGRRGRPVRWPRGALRRPGLRGQE
jgi:hypothetical protein